jgi:hypothetical protein
MINESQPVKTEEENEFKLKENQERFFLQKEATSKDAWNTKIPRVWPRRQHSC